MLPNLLSLDGHRRNSPFIELDERAKEILSRDDEFIGGNDDLLKSSDSKWIDKDQLDASNAFVKAKSAGGEIVLEIEKLIRGAEKDLKEFDNVIDNYWKY